MSNQSYVFSIFQSKKTDKNLKWTGQDPSTFKKQNTTK